MSPFAPRPPFAPSLLRPRRGWFGPRSGCCLLGHLPGIPGPSRRAPGTDLRRHRHVPGQLLIITDARRHGDGAHELRDRPVFCVHRPAFCTQVGPNFTHHRQKTARGAGVQRRPWPNTVELSGNSRFLEKNANLVSGVCNCFARLAISISRSLIIVASGSGWKVGGLMRCWFCFGLGRNVRSHPSVGWISTLPFRRYDNPRTSC